MRKRSNYKPKQLHIPKIAAMYRDFEQVDTFMKSVENDSVSIADDDASGKEVIVMRTPDKELYQVLPAMQSWCEFYRELAKEQNIIYNDTPMIDMMTKLESDMLLTKQLINSVKAVVDSQRSIYMKTPNLIINKISTRVMERL
jgi:hypothetical protein